MGQEAVPEPDPIHLRPTPTAAPASFCWNIEGCAPFLLSLFIFILYFHLFFSIFIIRRDTSRLVPTGCGVSCLATLTPQRLYDGSLLKRDLSVCAAVAATATVSHPAALSVRGCEGKHEEM